MLPDRWKKCVGSGGEYVEDGRVQASVWQLWFKKKLVPSYLNHLVLQPFPSKPFPLHYSLFYQPTQYTRILDTEKSVK
jgi:hypothetical protein